jgi:hypothetical protein
MDCVSFHLLSVFRSDATETQRIYISNGLKKAQQGTDPAIRTKDPAAQWLIGPIALPFLFQTHEQFDQGREAIQ